MLLNKVVQVEASRMEVIDYLRGRVKFGKFSAGDAVELTEDQEDSGIHTLLLWGSESTKPRRRMARGTVGVVQRHDPSDNTFLLMFISERGLVEQQWAPAAKLRLIERMPVEWVPSDLTKELCAANEMIEREKEAERSPLSDESEDDEKEEDRPVATEKDRISAIVERAAARSSGWQR